MSIQRNKLNIGKARRRVQMRSALLLTLGVSFAICVLRSLTVLSPGWQWTDMPATVACFGGGAYLGLCVLDGDHRRIVPLRALSRAQILWLALLGVLCVAPMTLAQDLLGRLAGMTAETAIHAPQRPVAFLQTVVKSALLAPVCEELFFRGYLLQALAPHGRLRAAIVTSLCFALVHPLQGFVPLVLFGQLLCLMTNQTGSLLAPVLLHMGYNLTLIVLDALGLSGLLMGWSFVSCVLRLALCAAFAAALKRAYTARTQIGSFVLWEGGKLTRRERIKLIAAALLMIATLITRRLMGL